MWATSMPQGSVSLTACLQMLQCILLGCQELCPLEGELKTMASMAMRSIAPKRAAAVHKWAFEREEGTRVSVRQVIAVHVV